MGIWHNIVIDKEKDVTCSVASSFSNRSFNLIPCEHKNTKLDTSSVATTNTFLLQKNHNIDVAIDGCIYNQKILCDTLGLNRESDIATMVTVLYKHYGDEGLYRLEGEFSIILHDAEKEKTLLYRTFLTGEPLYYVTNNNLLTVASNPVSLLHRSDISEHLDMAQMSGFFSLDAMAWTGTYFLDMNEVEHGEIVMVSANGVKIKKRALSEILLPVKQRSESEMIETYRDLVERAITKKFQSDKQYGIMLSSGMDSGTLAVLASRQLKKQGSVLRAYAWSLPSYQSADETEKIKLLCANLDIDLTLFNAENFMPFSNLDHLTLLPIVPLTNLFSPMISELYSMASKDGIDVLFNGHYGDNLFPPVANLFIDMLHDKRYELFIPTLQSISDKEGYRNALRKSPAIRNFIKHFIPFYKSKKAVFNVPKWLSIEAKEHRKASWSNQKKEVEAGNEIFAYALAKHSINSGMERYLTEPFGIKRIEPYRDIELFHPKSQDNNF